MSYRYLSDADLLFSQRAWNFSNIEHKVSPVSLRHLWVKLISTSESFGQNVDVTLALVGVGSTSIIVITVINFQFLCGHIPSIPTGKRHNSDATSTPKRRSDVAPTPKDAIPASRVRWDWVHTFKYAFNTRSSSSWPHTCIWSHQLLLFMKSRMHSIYFRRTAILDKQSPRQSYAVVTSSNHLAPTHTLTLTHPSPDNMAATSQTTPPNALPRITIYIHIYIYIYIYIHTYIYTFNQNLTEARPQGSNWH